MYTYKVVKKANGYSYMIMKGKKIVYKSTGSYPDKEKVERVAKETCELYN